MDEKLILKRLKEKDDSALEMLIEEYQVYATKIVSRIIVPPMSAEDVQEVVNDTFHKLWQNVDRIDLEKGNIGAYLTAIARNTAKNKFREFKESVPIQDFDYIEVMDVYEEMEQKERGQIIGDALNCLPEDERQILIRYYYLYQKTSLIAKEMCMSVNTIKSKLRRGRKKLETELQKRGVCK